MDLGYFLLISYHFEYKAHRCYELLVILVKKVETNIQSFFLFYVIKCKKKVWDWKKYHISLLLRVHLKNSNLDFKLLNFVFF